MIWHFLLHVTGSSDESSNWYAFWSGFAGDIPLLIALGLFGWHHNCHERRCWRLSTHRITEDGVSKIACRKHYKSGERRGH